MTDVIPFAAFREYKRLYSKVSVTAQGVYKEDEVPDSYKGDAELEVEVVHEILLCDAAGRLQRMVFDIPEALDNLDRKGGGYGLYTEGEGDDPPTPVQVPYINADYPATTGGATTPTKLYQRTSEHLDEQIKLRANEMVTISGGWPVPHVEP